MTSLLYLITRPRKIPFRIFHPFFALPYQYGAKYAAVCTESSVTRHRVWKQTAHARASNGPVKRIQVE
jgi:hypothetical protein